MARKNRRHRAEGFIFPAPLAVVLAALAGICLSYVGLNAKGEALGLEIKALEVRRDTLRRTLTREQGEWSQLQLPNRIDTALQAHGIVMTWPTRDQIVRLRSDGGRSVAVGGMRPARPAATARVAMND